MQTETTPFRRLIFSLAAVTILGCSNANLHDGRSNGIPPENATEVKLLDNDEFYDQWMTNCTPERQRHLNEIKNRYKDLIKTRNVGSCILGGVKDRRGRTTAPTCKNWSEAQFKLAGSLFGALAQYRNLELACWDPKNPRYGTHEDEAEIAAEISQWCFVCASIAQSKSGNDSDRPRDDGPETPDRRRTPPGQGTQRVPEQPDRPRSPNAPRPNPSGPERGPVATPSIGRDAMTPSHQGPIIDLDDLAQDRCPQHSLNDGWTRGIDDLDRLTPQNIPDRIVVPRGKTFAQVMEVLERIGGPVGRAIDIVEYIRDPTGAIIDEIIWRVAFTPTGVVIISYTAAYAALSAYACVSLVLAVELSGWQDKLDQINGILNPPYEPPVTQAELDSFAQRKFRQLDDAIIDLEILLDRWDEEPNPPSPDTRGEIMWGAKRIQDLVRDLDQAGAGREIDIRQIDRLIDRADRYDY